MPYVWPVSWLKDKTPSDDLDTQSEADIPLRRDDLPLLFSDDGSGKSGLRWSVLSCAADRLLDAGFLSCVRSCRCPVLVAVEVLMPWQAMVLLNIDGDGPLGLRKSVLVRQSWDWDYFVFFYLTENHIFEDCKKML